MFLRVCVSVCVSFRPTIKLCGRPCNAPFQFEILYICANISFLWLFCGRLRACSAAAARPTAVWLLRLVLKCLRAVIAPSAASSSSQASALNGTGSGNRGKHTLCFFVACGMWQTTTLKWMLLRLKKCSAQQRMWQAHECTTIWRMQMYVYVFVCVFHNFFLYEFLTNYAEQTNAWLKCLNDWMVEWIAGKQLKRHYMCVCVCVWVSEKFTFLVVETRRWQSAFGEGCYHCSSATTPKWV